MASVAQRIREAALAALRDIPGLSGRVYANREYPVTISGSLTLNTAIETAAEYPAADGQPVLAMKLLVKARAGGATAAAVVSALTASAEAAILSNLTLRGLTLAVEYLGSEPDFGCAEMPHAQVVSTFQTLFLAEQAPEHLPPGPPEFSAVHADVGPTAIRLECTTDRDCRIQARIHKVGFARFFYSAMEKIPKRSGHSVLISGLLPLTTYRAEIRADAEQDPDLDWTLFTDGLAGPDWTTLAEGIDPPPREE